MLNVFLFELKFRSRQISTYLFFVILFLLSFLFVASDVVRIGGGDGQVKVNAPLVLGQITGILSIFASVMVSALAGTAIYRDFETQTHELFFTTRLSKRAYFFGRFFGALLITLLVYSGLLWGVLFGTLMPWVDKATLMPFRADAYFNVFLTVLLPNMLLVSALFFVFGALTRNLLAIYALGVVLFIGWALSLSLLGNIENREIAALLDPFGLAALGTTTRYWTLTEKNNQLLPWTGALLMNRLLWSGVAVALLTVGYRLFQFAARAPVLLTRKTGVTTDPVPVVTLQPIRASRQAVGVFAEWVHLTGFYVRDVVRGVPFLIITLAGLLLLMVNAWNADEVLTNTIYPVTRLMVAQVSQSFMLFFLILVTFYGGELIWRERGIKLDQVTDALPTRTVATFLAKFTALLAILAGLTVVLMFAGMLVQAMKGYFRFEIGLYLSYLFGTIYPTLVCLAALSFVVHTLVNQKFLAYTLIIGFYIGLSVLPVLGLEHKLLLFGTTHDVTLSDMNGFGPFTIPVFWLTVYWLLCSTLLLILTQKLWVRGKDEALLSRWQNGRLPVLARVIAAGSGVAMVVVGGWCFYNMNILNDYLPRKAGEKLQENYEKTYKARWEKAPMPRITDVELDVTLWPERLQYAVKGTYRLKNKTKQTISDVVLVLDSDMTIQQMEFAGGASPTTQDKKIGFYVYRLKTPLPPQAETTLNFQMAYEKRGFPNDTPNTAIAANGSFLTMPTPRIGYQDDGEISDANERRKRDLPKRPRMPAVTDREARQNTYLGNDADWIGFRATVRTAPDQIAVAPGYLKREWNEQGRRCFRYEMDAPIRNFYTIVSARYVVKRDTWKSPEGKSVALEVFYHPGHEYNIETMLAGMKAALTYCSENFSPYQFRQARILEFPAYASFAQSFPNTIPYSESIGFILRVKKDDPEAINTPFYVTAHEIAHQWWAHQVIGANTEGSEMLSESLAEYSALMTLRKAFGKEFLPRFTRQDLDRYLDGRGSEREDENPLIKVQNQSYIHYPKGALVFFALAERIGEEKVNRVLSEFVKKTAFQEPPYTTAPELLAMLREVTPAQDQSYLTDLFEKITLYDLRVTDAKVQQNGKSWRVTATIQAAKKYSDGQGNETEAPLKEPIPVALRAKPVNGAKNGKIIGRSVVPLVTGKQTVTIESNTEPFDVVVDPLYLFIDRTPSDNVKRITR